jgi:hypothetical protein
MWAYAQRTPAALAATQDGVLCKLVDELRDNTAKEAALVLAVLLAATDDGSSSSSGGLSRQQLEGACEAFLQEQFDVEVCVWRERGDLGWLVGAGCWLLECCSSLCQLLIPVLRAHTRLARQPGRLTCSCKTPWTC